MKKIEDMTVLVCDHGQFLPLALLLGKSARKVFYCNLGARQTSFPEHWKGRVGEGEPDIEVVYDPFEHVDEIDLYVFTDIGEPEMQTVLAAPPPEGLGKLVWGNRRLEELENDRALMRRWMERAGLPTIPWKEVKGCDALEAYLKGHKDVWVKTKIYRGLAETWHAEDELLARSMLTKLRHDLGPDAKDWPFIIEEDYPDAYEVGIDAFSVCGQFPKKLAMCVETKGDAALGQIVKYSSLPPAMLDFNAALAPLLEEYDARGFLSTEHRIKKDGTGPMIDLCPRCPSPPGELCQLLYRNLPEIIAAGAQGVCLDPVTDHLWMAQLQMHSSWAGEEALAVEFPPEFEDYVKLRWSMRRGKERWVMKSGAGNNTIGSALGVGETPKEAIEHCKEVAKSIKGLKIEYAEGSLEHALSEIEKAEEWGQFTQ